MVINTISNYGRVGLIGRFKPLHNGANNFLRKLCENSDEVIIGIGSTNRYDWRNPFTPQETSEIISCALNNYNNFEFRLIPDYGSEEGNEEGHLWRDHIIREFGKLDNFVSGNPYVKELLKDYYKIIDPRDILDKNESKNIRSSEIRVLMARNEEFLELVPKEVYNYILENNLDKRFIKEFGKITLEQVSKGFDYKKKDDLNEEKLSVISGVRK